MEAQTNMIPALRMKLILLLLIGTIMVESTLLAQPYFPRREATYAKGRPQSLSFPFTVFNQPISDNTEQELDPTYSGSWEINIQSSLATSGNRGATEAEMAFAPAYPTESGSIPTIIVQERGDGLLRIEYFAQSWANTYGLVLYNYTAPNWMGGASVALRFKSFGPPSQVNPQLAPRPNGNVTISVSGTTVLTDYPIAWANLSDVYVYGIRGSSFIAGTIRMSIYELSPS
jgi:hypothetical protein